MFKIKKECPYKDKGQEYARVVKMLGDCRVMLDCDDGIERIGIIRGALQKKVWIKPDDIVLIGLRDFQDKKADIIFKYDPDDTKRMRREGAFTERKKTEEYDEVKIDFND